MATVTMNEKDLRAETGHLVDMSWDPITRIVGSLGIYTRIDFRVPDEAIGCGFDEAVRDVLSHHVVIRKGKIANYHPYPPTPWNANPRDIYGTPGPYEGAVQNTPIFEENGPDKFKGIDIMRAVRSFDPCLPCGVHMYLGNGKVLKAGHSPMFGTGGHYYEQTIVNANQDLKSGAGSSISRR